MGKTDDDVTKAIDEVAEQAEGLAKKTAEVADKFDALDLDGAERSLKESLRTIEDVNSMFPATQDFLRARGLTNIRELDDAGREELRKHLQLELQKLTGGTKS